MLEKEIIYQVFPQTFKDGLKTGSGNLKGITSKIEYLKWLGITRIWISPFCTSPFKDSGYDVEDYYAIDPKFGTMEDFEELVKTAKENGIGLIMDMVFNHTSDKNIWFQKALDGDKKYKDYYIFKDPVAGKEPTNWKSKMGGSSWEFVKELNQYYLHLFAKSQPDLNWRNKEVQNEIMKILDFWRKKGVTGFRMDVCNLYDKPEEFFDDFEGDGRRFYTDGKNIDKYFKMMNECVFSKIDDCITLGEISSTTKEKSAQYSKKENNELYSLFTFWHLKVDYYDNKKWALMLPDLNKMNEIFKEWQTYYQEQNASLALFLNCHDQPRSVSRFGNDVTYWKESAKTLFTYTSLMKGLPVIYQGEEIGMTNLEFNSINEFWDVETIGNSKDLLDSGIPEKEVLAILNQKARDHSRSAIQWNDSLNAGFTANKETNIFVNKNYKNINVENQIKEQDSILNYYKKLIELRKNEPALYEGSIEFVENEGKYFSYKRKKGNDEILILSNWSNNKLEVNKNLNNYHLIIGTHKKWDKIILRPWETIVLKRG